MVVHASVPRHPRRCSSSCSPWSPPSWPATPCAAPRAPSAPRAPRSLDALVIAELQAHYYKPVDAASLDQAGVAGHAQGAARPLHRVPDRPRRARRSPSRCRAATRGSAPRSTSAARTLVVTRVFAGSPAKAAGIAAGDRIVSVDGVAGGRRVGDRRRRRRIKGAEGTQVTLGRARRRQRAPCARSRSRGARSPRPETATQAPAPRRQDHRLHLRCRASPRAWGRPCRRDVARLQARGAQAFVLDLRYDLGGWIDEARNVSSDFLAGGVVVSTHGLHEPTHVYRATGASRDLAAARRARQPLVGERLRDHRRRPAGPPPGDDHRHAHLRQGRRADELPAARRRHPAHDDRRLPHPERPRHQPQGHHAHRDASSTIPRRRATRRWTGRCSTSSAAVKASRAGRAACRSPPT